MYSMSVTLQDLISELKSELSGRFERAILALFYTPSEHDAYELRSAMKVGGLSVFISHGCVILPADLPLLTFICKFITVLYVQFLQCFGYV